MLGAAGLGAQSSEFWSADNWAESAPCFASKKYFFCLEQLP